ncbi:MAG: hypothetical protein SPE93_08250 [Candidatus Limivicinus sp.]|nr:hypothetical protein [Candidatus Limivicinus sp.]
MNKKKLIAAVICLVLVITAALPGTLAVSADAASSDGTISVATPETAQTPAGSAAADEAVPQSEEEKPAEPEPEAETKTCTCDPAPAEGEAHNEACPLYVAPEKPAEEPKTEPKAEEKTCTCDPAPAEGEAHKEGCPLYVAPEKPDEETPAVHIEGCSDDCTAEDCKCACHLMKKIMECKTLEEIWAIIAETPEEELNALSEEQIAKIEAKIEELEPAPAPAVTVKAADSIVESEIFATAVNYTNVAPFGEPVGCGQ